MLKISLNRIFFMALRNLINTYSYRKDQSFPIDRGATSGIGKRFPCWQEPYIPYALPRNSFEITGSEIRGCRLANGNDTCICKCLGGTLRVRRNCRFGNTSRTWAKANNGLLGQRSGSQSHRAEQAEREESQGILAAGLRKGSEREYVPSFFIRIGTRYRRIRKRSKGKPSPQLYAYKIAHLNIVETLWRILKGKWLRQADYVSTDSLFYATNRALAAVGDELIINFTHAA